MNFCEESDLYISLYIDNLLEESHKEKFLQHIEECPHCAQKLKEESYFAQLCQDNEEIALPDDFSASLHSKLIEVSEKEYNNSKKLFIFNKKVMAGLSTAAVVVISLLAYNLIPGLGTVMDKTSSSLSGGASAQSAAAAAGNADDSVHFSESVTAGNEKGKYGANFAGADSSTESAPSSAAAQKASGVEQARPEADTVSGSSGNSNERKAASAKKADKQSPAVKSSKVEESSNLKITACFNIAADQAVKNEQQYFSNYAEMDLSVSSAENEMEKLKLMMTDYGASEQESGMINGYTANMDGTAAYIEYSIPISVYGSLQSEALLKYKLDLKPKTDIIKNNITEEYNILTSQKLNIENKISEALKKGEDTSTFEAEKSTLIKKIDELAAKNRMITIRIFFVKK